MRCASPVSNDFPPGEATLRDACATAVVQCVEPRAQPVAELLEDEVLGRLRGDRLDQCGRRRVAGIGQRRLEGEMPIGVGRLEAVSDAFDEIAPRALAL